MIDRLLHTSKGPDKKASEKTRWQEFLDESRKHPIGREYLVARIITELNSKTELTNEEFYLSVVNDKNNGPVVSQKIKPLPQSIVEGKDDNFSAYEIRYNESGSLDAVVGNSILLCLFLCDLNGKTNCYLFGNDPNSKTNWEILLDRHQKLFDPE